MSDADGETQVAGIESRQVVSSGTATLMRSLLASVVENGTGQSAAVDGYRVGGKTGTANKLGSDGRYTEITRASFVGMAPINDSQIVVAVLMTIVLLTKGLESIGLHFMSETPEGEMERWGDTCVVL